MLLAAIRPYKIVWTAKHLAIIFFSFGLFGPTGKPWPGRFDLYLDKYPFFIRLQVCTYLFVQQQNAGDCVMCIHTL